MKILYENCEKTRKICEIFGKVSKNFENITRNFLENLKKRSSKKFAGRRNLQNKIPCKR